MKVPEPRKLNSGNYFIQLRLNGVSVPVTASTAKECKRQAELIKAEHRAGKRQIQAQTDVTLRQAVDAYIAKRKQTISPSTLKGYQAYADYRFPKYMDKPIKNIDWQQMINDELKVKAPKTVKNAWGLVASAIRSYGYAPEIALAQVPKKKEKFLTAKQALVFIEGVKGKSYEIPALLALHGLRRSEVYGLEWSNVNLEAKSLYVSGAVVMGADKTFVAKETNKNETSTRYVPIMIPQLLDALNAVEDKTGKVVKSNPNDLYRNVNRVCRNNGLPEVGVHGLRRSIASLGHKVGMSEHELMELGGWKDYHVMHDLYIAVAASDVKEKTDLISEFFENANENANETQKV